MEGKKLLKKNILSIRSDKVVDCKISIWFVCFELGVKTGKILMCLKMWKNWNMKIGCFFYQGQKKNTLKSPRLTKMTIVFSDRVNLKILCPKIENSILVEFIQQLKLIRKNGCLLRNTWATYLLTRIVWVASRSERLSDFLGAEPGRNPVAQPFAKLLTLLVFTC